jgi:hypothetical protein
MLLRGARGPDAGLVARNEDVGVRQGLVALRLRQPVLAAMDQVGEIATAV